MMQTSSSDPRPVAPRAAGTHERFHAVSQRVQQAVVQATLRLPKTALRALCQSRLAPVDGKRLDLELAVLLTFDDFLKQVDPTLAPLAVSRARIARAARFAAAKPRQDVSAEDISLPGPAGPIPARVYSPSAVRTPSPGVLFMHGGGFVTCNLDTHDAWCRRLAATTRARLVSVDYRLSPEHKFPAAVEDSVAAFRWLAQNAGRLGIDPARIAVMGDSAGGNLASVVALVTKTEAVKPCLQVLVYPVTAGALHTASKATFGKRYFLTQQSIDWYYAQYTSADTHPKDPMLAPFFAPDLSGLPQALIYTAGFDPLVDEGRDYAERLQEAGVETTYRCFDSLVHGFTLMDGLCSAADVASEEICHDLASVLHPR